MKTQILVPIEPTTESAPDLPAATVLPCRRCLDLQGWILALACLVMALFALLSSE